MWQPGNTQVTGVRVGTAMLPAEDGAGWVMLINESNIV